jgi:hypothetical protein
LETDLSPKPAFYAYQTVTRQLSSTDYVRSLSPAEAPLAGAAAMSKEIEAYEFLSATGPTRVIVAGTNDNLSHTLVLPIDRLVHVDKYGNETLIRDGDDGQVDEFVQVPIGPSPVYLRLAASQLDAAMP